MKIDGWTATYAVLGIAFISIFGEPGLWLALCLWWPLGILNEVVARYF